MQWDHTALWDDITQERPTAPNLSYLLCDSWYICGKVMDAFLSKGFYTIGSLKSNRILFPYGARLSVSELAKKLVGRSAGSFFTS